MPAKRRYTNIANKIVAGKFSGQRSLLITDCIGSVVQAFDESANEMMTCRYWPYGEIYSLSGVLQMSILYAGSHGYYSDGGRTSYVRSRVYVPGLGQWLSSDKYWPREPRYVYCDRNPVTKVDPMGLSPKCQVDPCKWARETYPELNNPAIGAFPVCCNGFKFYCISPLGDGEVEPPVHVKACTALHEIEHFSDFECPCTGMSVPEVKNADASECRAYSLEFRCLQDRRYTCKFLPESERSACEAAFFCAMCDAACATEGSCLQAAPGDIKKWLDANRDKCKANCKGFSDIAPLLCPR